MVLDINDKDLLKVRTVQTSQRFYFIPNGGWKRGVNYRPTEEEVIKEVNALLTDGVMLVGDRGRYFEYHLVSETISTEGATDNSTGLVAGIKTMFLIAEKHDLKLLTYS